MAENARAKNPKSPIADAKKINVQNDVAERGTVKNTPIENINASDARTDNAATTSTHKEALISSMQKLLQQAVLMEEILLALSSKRETLEEKIIKNCLNQTMSAIGEFVADIHEQLQDKTFDIEKLENVEMRLQIGNRTTFIEELSWLSDCIEQVFSELKRMIDYDWNFLEQYYEHELCVRLINEHRFCERLKALSSCVCTEH